MEKKEFYSKLIKAGYLSQLNLEDGIVFFDLETTGFSSQWDNIIEIASTKFTSEGEYVDTYNTLLKPYKPISAKITELTGISNEMVEKERSMFEILPEFREFIGKAIMVAHNAFFDMDFLNDKLEFVNKYRNEGEKLEKVERFICTLQVFKSLFPNEKAKLEIIAKKIGYDLTNAHRAYADVEALIAIFLEYAPQVPDLGEFIRVHGVDKKTNFRQKSEAKKKQEQFNIANYMKNKTPISQILEDNGMELQDIIEPLMEWLNAHTKIIDRYSEDLMNYILDEKQLDLLKQNLEKGERAYNTYYRYRKKDEKPKVVISKYLIENNKL